MHSYHKEATVGALVLVALAGFGAVGQGEALEGGLGVPNHFPLQEAGNFGGGERHIFAGGQVIR